MTLNPPHRKSVRHFNVLGHAHLLTFSCYRRLPLLTNDVWRALLSDRINWAAERHRFGLIAFVYMPEHLHLLVHSQVEECTVQRILYSIKKPFADKIKQLLTESNSPLLSRLTVQERPGKIVFRFWQEGPGHDRNLLTVENCIKAAEYIHNNPVRRRLCRSPNEWKWSSWKFYHQAPVLCAHLATPHQRLSTMIKFFLAFTRAANNRCPCHTNACHCHPPAARATQM
ncbi:MAG: transposase [Planctomycetota bacterium]